MSLEYPYSKYFSVIFKTTDNIFNSKIVKINDTNYKEVITDTFTPEEINHIKFKFADQMYKDSLEFESDEIEVVASSIEYSIVEGKRMAEEDVIKLF